MTLDHIAYVFLNPDSSAYFLMRFFGRFTAPIMAFFIAEGFVYTSSRKKYFLRLFAFGIISQPFYFLMIFSRPPENSFEFFTNLNVMFTLCSSLLSLIILENKKISLAGKAILIGICFAIADLCDWSYIIPAWTITFFLFKKSKYKNTAFIIISVLMLIQRFMQSAYNLGVLFALIPLNLYSGKQNFNKNKFAKSIGKRMFYIYYPLHIAVIVFLKFYF